MNQFLINHHLDFKQVKDRLSDLKISLSEQEWNENAEKKVMVGLSGGVDSSVAALLLLLQNYQVEALFMKNWDGDDEECTAEDDFSYAQKVANRLGINLYSLNLAEEYFNEVFTYFLNKIKQGETPNPDILCNREVKFKKFYDLCLAYGADYMATGHYAQLIEDNAGKIHMSKGVDLNKDQTYFLAEVDSRVFPQVLFPLGGIHKKKVRELALQFNLASAKKKDSTGICFIGERKFKQFIANYIEKTKGNFVSPEGKVLGKHDGLGFYTIGQRKGLGIGGPGGPFFVSHKNNHTNEITVVEGEDHPLLFAKGIWLTQINFFHAEYAKTSHCKVKIRYRQQEVPCQVKRMEQGYYIAFESPVRAATRMQYAVLYQGETCLGGGEIQEVHNAYTDDFFKQLLS